MVRFVTGHSPAAGARSGMRLVTLRGLPASDGGQLVLTDIPCPSLYELGALLESGADNAPSPGEASQSWTVAEGVVDPSFEYLEIPAETGEPERWVSRWRDTKSVPRAVRIRWTSDTSRGAQQHLVTVPVLAEAGSLGGPAR